ncbi:beta strand repeat-containing protein [Halobellus ruber]|uniref:beta strand repeat-containing protein n=1 Tax=Halobellus ruber TaxID=2761102 RepID=UPI001626A6B1|nr:surface glycoprotein [Halobellus ruber]
MRDKTRAVLLAIITVTSVFGGTVAFAGGAAATVQDFDGVTADDVAAGPSAVEQTITLENVENDGNAGTIEISNDLSALNDTVLAGPGTSDGTTRVSTANGHNASVSEVTSNGTIVVDLAAGSAATADIVVTAELDLSSLQDETITYTAESTGNGITQTDTFDISVAQPQISDGNAVIPESAPNTIEVTFDENIALAEGATEEDAADAFSVSGDRSSFIDLLSVESIVDISGDTIVLGLNDFVRSDETDIEVSYTGSGGGDPIANAADTSVTALDSTDSTVTNNAVPTLAAAVTTDGEELSVGFSEQVSGSSDGDIASAFSLSDDRADISGVVENADEGAGGEVILDLDSEIEPGTDLTGLSYDGSNNGEPITADSTGDPAFDFQNRNVTNYVAPSIQSAEVTTAEPDRILLTYDSEVGPRGDVDGPFEFDNNQYDLGGYGFDPDDGTRLELFLDFSGDDVQASDGSLGTLNYSANIDEGVESVSGGAAQSPQTVTVANNVSPTFESAEVTSSQQVQVTFSEPVTADVGSGNIDSAVTEAFEVQNSDVDYRVKNVANKDSITDGGVKDASYTVILTLGEADGTTQEVAVDDDLTGALSYDPSAPSGDEENPLVADGGTEAAAEGFTDENVTNNVGTGFEAAEVTTDGEELRVTFTEEITQVGTDSEIESAFEVGSDTVSLSRAGTYTGIENGNTIVFENSSGNGFVIDPAGYNSGTDLGENDRLNGLSYEPIGNSPLEIEATGESVSSFGTDPSFSSDDKPVPIRNNIQPRIESAEVTNDDPSRVVVTYSENVSVPADEDDALDAFSLNGSDASDITRGYDNDGDSVLILELESDVENGDDLGSLTYSGNDTGPVESGEDDDTNTGSAVAINQTLAVDNNVGSKPVLQNVTIDDAPENNDDDSQGQMLLAFDRDVAVTGDAVDGLSFESNTTDASVNLFSINGEESAAAPDNVVVVDFVSVSGSVSSSVRQGDDLSDASLTVDTGQPVDIEGTEADNFSPIADGKVTDVNNEIAGDLAAVDSTEIDAELIGLRYDEKGSYTVTVSGFRDANGAKVIDDRVLIRMGGFVFLAGNRSDTVDLPRYGDTVTFDRGDALRILESPAEAGNEVTIEVRNADVSNAGNITYATVSNSENVTFVHSAFTASEGYQLTSQPMPGQFVSGGNISDVTYYDGNQDSFASYGAASQVQRVHNGLFVNAETDGAEYGFVYDTDRSGAQTNVGSIEMDEGWHIVGSNFDVTSVGEVDARKTDTEIGNELMRGSVTLETDLATEHPPESAVLDAQLKSVPGTTLQNTAAVNPDGVYYVYVYQNDTRQIFLPEHPEFGGEPRR